MDCVPVELATGNGSHFDWKTDGVSRSSANQNGSTGEPIYIMHKAANHSLQENMTFLAQRLMGNNSIDPQFRLTGSNNNFSSLDVENFIYGRVIIIICILGVIGNILNLIVLTRKGLQKTMDRMEKSAHYGLVALALSDMIFCLVVLPHAWVDKTQFFFEARSFSLIYIVYESGVINAFIMSSTWLTVAMATSRYLAICHPLKAREIIGMTFAKSSIIVVFVLCILFNLPRFFMSRIDTMDCVGGWSVFFIHKGPLRRNPSAESAYLWCYSVLGILFPLLALAYCNINLIRALKESFKMRAQYKNSSSSKDTESEHQITLTLIIIVVMYFVLVLPAEVINFLKKTAIVEAKSYANFNVGVSIVNMLQAVNFSFNFVLYCVINVHFRRTFMDLLCCCLVDKHSTKTRYTSVTSGVSFSATKNATIDTEC